MALAAISIPVMAGGSGAPDSVREIRRTLLLAGQPGVDSSASKRIFPLVFKEARRSRRMKTLELVNHAALANNLLGDTYTHHDSTLKAVAASGLADEVLWVHLLDFNQHEVPLEEEEEKERNRNLAESVLYSLFFSGGVRYNVRTRLSVELERVVLASGETSVEKASGDFTGGDSIASLQSAMGKLGEDVQPAIARLYRQIGSLTPLTGHRVRMELDPGSDARAGALFLVRNRPLEKAGDHPLGESSGRPKALVVMDENGSEKTGRVVRQWEPFQEGDVAEERPGRSYRHWSMGLLMQPMDPASKYAMEAAFGLQPHRVWDLGGALRMGFLRDSRREYDFFVGVGAPIRLSIHRNPRWTLQGGVSMDADILFSFDDRGDQANALILGALPHARLHYLVSSKVDVVLTAGYRFFGTSTGWWTTPKDQNSRPAHWNGDAPKIETGGFALSLGLDFSTF